MSKTIDRQDFVRSLRDFVKRECGTRERRQELSSNGHVTHNQELYRKLAGLGWVGCAIPAEYGGGGGSASDACHLVEEMSYGLAPLFGLGVSLVSATVVERFGTEEQKQDILGGVCRGEVLATAISEPGAGSDPASMMCRAERRGDSYVINGQKTWISCAHIASRIQVLCRTDTSGSKHDGITMIDVPADTEGLEVRTIPTLGGDEVNDVFFTDVTVSAFGAGIESITADSAQVLIAAAVNTSTAGMPAADPRHWRMRITVQQVDDQVKVSNVEFVP